MFGTHVQKVNVTGPLLLLDDDEVPPPPHAVRNAMSAIISPGTTNFTIKRGIQRGKERQGIIGALLSAHNSKEQKLHYHLRQRTAYSNARCPLGLKCKLRFSRHTCDRNTSENLSVSWINCFAPLL